VQHQEGGIIARIFVDDGVQVNEGDTLIHLDDTQTRARLTIVLKQLAQRQARVARLKAERDNTSEPRFADPKSDDEREAIETERALFFSRREALANSKAQLAQRIFEIENGIHGVREELASIEEQLRIAQLEHAGLKQLFDQQHVPITRVLQLEREIAGLKGRCDDRLDVTRISQANPSVSPDAAAPLLCSPHRNTRLGTG
jgi:HlyD family secretion protein